MLSTGCEIDQPVLDPSSGYPTEIGAIMETQCAVTGCHDGVSNGAAAGLNLESWETLFQGSRNNAAIIPYRPDQSFMMFFVNTYEELGPSLTPQMPYGADPLSKSEVLMIENWIAQGAPNKDGFVKFSDDSEREKIYILNQGCDLLGVMDKETRLMMRYIDVGTSVGIEAPHFIHMSEDGLHYYVCYYTSNVFHKFRSEDDVLVGEADIGFGSWNTFALSADGTIAFVVDLSASGSIAVVDVETMTMIVKYGGAGLFDWPHGSMVKDANTLYITSQFGNFIYKIDISDIQNPNIEKVVLGTGESPSAASKYDAHEMRYIPDKTEYAVTCQKSGEVRFFDATTDSLLAVVSTGDFPQEISVSSATPYLFVTCMEDETTFPGTTGSVAVIDYTNHTLVKSIYTGHQPHGLEADDAENVVYVLNRNATSEGPAPHHVTDCGGRNGYMTIIDMGSLELTGYKAELSVDPIYMAITQ
jgi:DNA-binding beta-propeller fold protein YncE